MFELFLHLPFRWDQQNPKNLKVTLAVLVQTGEAMIATPVEHPYGIEVKRNISAWAKEERA